MIRKKLDGGARAKRDAYLVRCRRTRGAIYLAGRRRDQDCGRSFAEINRGAEPVTTEDSSAGIEHHQAQRAVGGPHRFERLKRMRPAPAGENCARAASYETEAQETVASDAIRTRTGVRG